MLEQFLTQRIEGESVGREFLMPDIGRDLAVLRAAIALAERSVVTQSECLMVCPSDSAEARYARTVLHVLNRSLPKMYRRRKGLTRELQRQKAVRAAKRSEALSWVAIEASKKARQRTGTAKLAT
jgi:hypothetical protein